MKDRNEILKFLNKLLLFLGIVVCLDFGVGKVLEYLYFRQTSGSFYRTTYAMEQTTAEALIFGSSRALYNYHPLVFLDSLRFTCYNAGADGQKIFYSAALNKVVLNRYRPRLIVLDVNPDELSYTPEGYDRLNILLPYYHRHQELGRFIALRGRFEPLKLFSQIYPYNSTILSIAVGNIPLNKTRNEDIEGYIPLDQTLDTSIICDLPHSAFAASITIDSNKVKAYLEFVSNTVNAGVPLVIAMSPAYRFHTDTSDIAIMRTIAASRRVPFLDFLCSNRYSSHPEYFSDIGHLNRRGALLFTSEFVHAISSLHLEKLRTPNPTLPSKIIVDGSSNVDAGGSKRDAGIRKMAKR